MFCKQSATCKYEIQLDIQTCLKTIPFETRINVQNTKAKMVVRFFFAVAIAMSNIKHVWLN